MTRSANIKQKQPRTEISYPATRRSFPSSIPCPPHCESRKQRLQKKHLCSAFPRHAERPQPLSFGLKQHVKIRVPRSFQFKTETPDRHPSSKKETGHQKHWVSACRVPRSRLPGLDNTCRRANAQRLGACASTSNRRAGQSRPCLMAQLSLDCWERGANCVSAACFWQGVPDGARPRPHGDSTSPRHGPG